MNLVVTKRSGKTEVADFSKAERALIWASQGLSVDYKEIFNEDTYTEFFYDGISTTRIQNLLANKAETKSTENWDWTYLAARLVLQKYLKEAHGNNPYKTETDYYLHFSDYLSRVEKEGVKQLQFQRIREHFDLDKITAAIKPERDLTFQFMGITTLADRYLIKNEANEIIEAPQHFFMRVALGLAFDEDKQIATEIAIEYYNAYSNKDFLSSTPTLFNSATTRSQLSSCFVFKTQEDSLEGIYGTAEEIAKCSKFSGGTANSMTPLRAKGSKIKSTGGKSSGVVQYEKLYEQTVRSFDQGGKRPGVVALYLETWHMDIFDFLNSIKASGDERVSVRDVNLATWIPDLFMQRVENDEDWTLFSPNNCPDLHELHNEEFVKAYTDYENNTAIPKKVVKAKDVWKAILTCLFNNKGNGWPCFKDTINRRSMTRGYGVVHSSNLCTEITLRQGKSKIQKDDIDRVSVCNLGSINLSQIKTKEQLERTIRLGVRMIDSAISEGYIPIESGKLFNDEDRPLGLGIMGYSEFLAAQGIAYNSEEHFYAADILLEFISYTAIDESSRLGAYKGNFPMFEHSQWAKGELPMDTGYNEELQNILDSITYRNDFFENLKVSKNDWESLRLRSSKNMRNSQLLAIAPTASIANIFGCTSCTELPQETKYQKTNLSGTFAVVSSLYRNYKDTNPKLVCDAQTCDPYYIVVGAAVRQKWVDQSQSTNIWVDDTITAKKLSNIYKLGWRLGNKTFYYLRSVAPDIQIAKNDEIQNYSPIEPENTEEIVEGTFCDMSEGCLVCQ